MTNTLSNQATNATDSPSAAYRRGAALDAQVRTIAQRAVEGDLDDATARWDIAALVVQSRLASVHASRFTKRSPTSQASQDLAEQLDELLVRKIAGDATSASILDLAHLANRGSVSAFISAFSQSAMLSVQRNLARARNRTGIPLAPVGEGSRSPLNARGVPAASFKDTNSDLEYAALGSGARAVSVTSWETAERIAAEDAATTFEHLSNQARETKATHLRAVALCTGFGVPAPQRVEDDAAAAALRDGLTSQPRAALRAVSALVNDQTPLDALDAAVAQMWKDHPRHILERLADADHRVAQAITLSAVTPVPQLDQTVLKAVRSAAQADLGTPKGSQRLNAVITAWAEQACGMRVSEFFPGNVNPMARENLKTEAERRADRASFEAAVTALLTAGVTSFGMTAPEIDSELRARFATRESEGTQRRARAS
jgi:hypothetical protein